MKPESISRRNFLRNIAGAAGFTAAAGALPLFSSCGRKEQRPNFIFLLTDDQRWDALGAAGNPIIFTPNMDQLAREGVHFTQAFVTTSICCTSRASIFLGQYARRHGIWDFSTDFSQVQLENTYDMLLKNQGYSVGFIGKYGVGSNLPADRYHFWRGIPGQPKYEQTGADGRSRHLTGILGDQAIEFLESTPSGKPFCLSISFKAPHVQDEDPRQFIYDPALESLYSDIDIPVPETADPRFFNGLPGFMRQNSMARHRWQMRFSTPEMYQQSVKGYYRLVTGVDLVLGRIREELQRRGQSGNTVIVLTGDNGFFLSEHGMAGKWFGYEESIRVPLIIYDPRQPAAQRGRRRAEMVLNIDIAPTILELAGLPVPEAMQGRSLTPLLLDESLPWREAFFYEHLFENEQIPPSEGLVTGRYKYLRYPSQDPVYEQLFDRVEDPHETVNQIENADLAQILTIMRRNFEQYRAAAR